MPHGAHALFRQTKVFGSLDGLRCISILAVIFHHAVGHQYAGTPLATLGNAGVMLFFTISGFLITTLLLREKERRGRIDLTAFYAAVACAFFRSITRSCWCTRGSRCSWSATPRCARSSSGTCPRSPRTPRTGSSITTQTG